MLRRNPQIYHSDASRLALEVLRQIDEAGIDSVRVTTVADRLEMSIGKLYRRWGGRLSLIEHAWRMCLHSVEYEVRLALRAVTPACHGLDHVWSSMLFGLPIQLDAFYELHSARRRWHRKETEPEGVVIPSLETYVHLGQDFHHVRDGMPRSMAALIWATTLTALSGGGRNDEHNKQWHLDALKRAILIDERWRQDLLIDAIQITVEEPTPNHQ